MKCPFCGNLETKVLETRELKEGVGLRRRRQCPKCEARFTTMETVSWQFPLVVKKDGRREEFSKAKLARGIQLACQKRPIGQTLIDQMVENICRQVLARPEKEIQSSWIGERVMAALKQVDHVAYVRFASVYRNFKDVDEFVQKLKEDWQSIAQSDADAQQLSLRL